MQKILHKLTRKNKQSPSPYTAPPTRTPNSGTAIPAAATAPTITTAGVNANSDDDGTSSRGTTIPTTSTPASLPQGLLSLVDPSSPPTNSIPRGPNSHIQPNTILPALTDSSPSRVVTTPAITALMPTSTAIPVSGQSTGTQKQPRRSHTASTAATTIKAPSQRANTVITMRSFNFRSQARQERYRKATHTEHYPSYCLEWEDLRKWLLKRFEEYNFDEEETKRMSEEGDYYVFQTPVPLTKTDKDEIYLLRSDVEQPLHV